MKTVFVDTFFYIDAMSQNAVLRQAAEKAVASLGQALRHNPIGSGRASKLLFRIQTVRPNGGSKLSQKSFDRFRNGSD